MQTERYGTRDQAYSAWHRAQSTRRYVGIEEAARLSMIDLDGALYVEYDDRDREPLALIETARDVGQKTKACTVTARPALRAAGLRGSVPGGPRGQPGGPVAARHPDVSCAADLASS